MTTYQRFYSEKRAKEYIALVKKQGLTARLINEFDGYGQPIFTVEVII